MLSQITIVIIMIMIIIKAWIYKVFLMTLSTPYIKNNEQPKNANPVLRVHAVLEHDESPLTTTVTTVFNDGDQISQFKSI